MLTLLNFAELSVDVGVRSLPKVGDGVEGNHGGGPAPQLGGRFSDVADQTSRKAESMTSTSSLRLKTEDGLVVIGRCGRWIAVEEGIERRLDAVLKAAADHDDDGDDSHCGQETSEQVVDEMSRVQHADE